MNGRELPERGAKIHDHTYSEYTCTRVHMCTVYSSRYRYTVYAILGRYA